MAQQSHLTEWKSIKTVLTHYWPLENVIWILKSQNPMQVISIAIKVMAWMSNSIPLFYMDVITYPCPNPDSGLANFSW